MEHMPIFIRLAEERDVEAMAAIRARRWGTRDFWVERIGPYLKGKYFPQQALPARAVFVADNDGAVVVGFVAGHQTRRFGCDGELEWIDVAEEWRRTGIAAKLLAHAGSWFVQNGLGRVCVNVDPDNAPARGFYAKHGAVALNDYWMVWEDAGSMSGPAV
jgi:GNAT superfamily N-acetyltransferase